ncbi:DUF2815 family protein [Alteromonas mediterranea]|uniref:DUF2815 family protein n=1 Tax=Alteromonas mediterranea TaxID=314275 RepID=UPI0032B14F40
MSTIILKNVRLSFPQIWTAKAYMEGQTAKYSANLLLDKEADAEQVATMKKAIKKEATRAFSGDIPKGLKTCLGDGVEKAYDGYENAMFVSCSSRQRPTIIDRDRTQLVEEDDKPYAGCYVNAAISLWVQNNNFGKRINCNLTGLQFVKDGERFGGGGIKVDDVFDDISKEQAADAADDDFLD